MIDAWSARQIASMDAEDYYVYTESRPHVRLVDGLHRDLTWPSIDVYAHQDAQFERDVVLMVGHEPHLRWRTFAREVTRLLERLKVSRVVLLGSLLADVPHTRDPRLSGSASDDDLRRRLEHLDVAMSRYEGPTGIVGAVQDACARDGFPVISLWGSVPHYITASPNPEVSAALLRHVDRLLGLGLNLRGLEGQGRRFRARVDEAIAQSPEAAAYVRELEEREEDASGPTAHSPLPTGPEVVRALEEYLRQQRSDGDDLDDA